MSTDDLAKHAGARVVANFVSGKPAEWAFSAAALDELVRLVLDDAAAERTRLLVVLREQVAEIERLKAEVIRAHRD